GRGPGAGGRPGEPAGGLRVGGAARVGGPPVARDRGGGGGGRHRARGRAGGQRRAAAPGPSPQEPPGDEVMTSCWGVGRVMVAGEAVPWAVSAADVDDEADAMAGLLSTMGVGRGDVV